MIKHFESLVPVDSVSGSSHMPNWQGQAGMSDSLKPPMLDLLSMWSSNQGSFKNAMIVTYISYLGRTSSLTALKKVFLILAWAERHVLALPKVNMPYLHNWLMDSSAKVFHTLCQR